MYLLSANQSDVVMAVSLPTVSPLTTQLNLAEGAFDLLWTLKSPAHQVQKSSELLL